MRPALAAGLLAAAGAAPAAPSSVEPFDAGTWHALVATAPVPTAVVFTATYCANCPQAIAGVAQALREARRAQRLLVVVIDAAPGDRTLLAQAHYREADRLYAFAAPAAQVQHAVNPRWRGITPSVALLRPDAAPQWITGVPADEVLRAWAGAPRAAARP